MRKAIDRLVRVVHGKRDAFTLEVVHVQLGRLASAFRCVDKLKLAGAGSDEVGRAVLECQLSRWTEVVCDELTWSPKACRPIQIGLTHPGTGLGIDFKMIGSRKTVPPRMFRIYRPISASCGSLMWATGSSRCHSDFATSP